MPRTCPPCSGDCNQGRDCSARLDGGGYWPALHAQDDYQHLSKPAPIYTPLSVNYADDSEPMSDFAVACWWAAGAFAAFIVAAGFVDWLMSF